VADYAPPVAQLLHLGEPDFSAWADYAALGFTSDHVPELLRLLQDEALAKSNDPVVVCGQFHAWRALGQLKAEAAIEPLLDLLAAQENEDDWNEWLTEDVPLVLGMIGPPALEPAATRLEQTFGRVYAPVYYSQALCEIADRHPETRDEVMRRLTAYLDRAPEHDASTNGMVISDLVRLNAAEAWPVIEKAFASGEVDEQTTGTVDHVKYDLGLGPMPADFRYPALEPLHRPLTANPSLTSARIRAEKRAKKRKAAKRQAKRSR
jgi:hypothetical protein